MCQISVYKDCYGVDCETCPFNETLSKHKKLKQKIVNNYKNIKNRYIRSMKYNDELWNE